MSEIWHAGVLRHWAERQSLLLRCFILAVLCRTTADTLLLHFHSQSCNPIGPTCCPAFAATDVLQHDCICWRVEHTPQQAGSLLSARLHRVCTGGKKAATCDCSRTAGLPRLGNLLVRGRQHGAQPCKACKLIVVCHVVCQANQAVTAIASLDLARVHLCCILAPGGGHMYASVMRALHPQCGAPPPLL